MADEKNGLPQWIADLCPTMPDWFTHDSCDNPNCLTHQEHPVPDDVSWAAVGGVLLLACRMARPILDALDDAVQPRKELDMWTAFNVAGIVVTAMNSVLNAFESRDAIRTHLYGRRDAMIDEARAADETLTDIDAYHKAINFTLMEMGVPDSDWGDLHDKFDEWMREYVAQRILTINAHVDADRRQN
jgi:hypothetical protein